MHTRHGFFNIVIVATCLALLISCSLFQAPRHPHVVLIIVDTLRADRLGCYGYERATSPELDALAARGARFARTISQSPWTRPSIGSMLTSMYPRSLGIYEETEGVLNDRFVTLAEILHDAGYRTFGAVANPHLNRSFNFQQGFDEYLESTEVWPWMDDFGGQKPASHPALPSARQLFDEALAWIDSEDPSQRSVPHYLQFNLMELHETWGQNDLVRPEFKSEFSDIPGVKQRHYLQGLRQVSRDIGWLVDLLASRPGFEDVLYVIISDHGEGLDSHPHIPKGDFHGVHLYESVIRVPWILFDTASRIPAGTVVEERVRLLELVPTLLELAGVEAPGPLEGKSALPLLRKTGTVDLPDGFVVETQFWDSDKIAVYTQEWKMILNRDGKPEVAPRELQRIGTLEDGLRTDVGEQNPDVLQRLGKTLDRWEQRVPRVAATRRGEELSEEALEQLRNLGYVR